MKQFTVLGMLFLGLDGMLRLRPSQYRQSPIGNPQLARSHAVPTAIGYPRSSFGDDRCGGGSSSRGSVRGGVAAGGAGAAGFDASDRICQRDGTRQDCGSDHCISSRPREAGYVNGRNVEIEYWSADDRYDRLPSLVAESIRRRVAVIVVPDTPGARAAKAATRTIPVVFLVGQDPVEAGLVSNLNGSGTNITGVSILNTGLIGKRLQLMRQMLPDVATVAALADPTNFGIVEAYAKEAATSARVLGVRLVTLNASSPIEIDAAFASLAEQRVGALLVTGHLMYLAQRSQIVALAVRYHIPVMYPYRPYTEVGGLISYGPSVSEPWRLLGNYTGRVLKGTSQQIFRCSKSPKLS